MTQIPPLDIKAIIGLGNPGPNYYYTRHSIGFRILDELAKEYGLSWQSKENQEIATLIKDGKKIIFIKPQTFMNSSGKVIPGLLKQGIKAENILVVHDELEQPFGNVRIKVGGSAHGHNGLKSIIAACGDQFARLQFGIGRPTFKEDVPKYVLEKFKENPEDLEHLIQKAVSLLQAQL
jgi:peptidyl-tRNA hydrolase, PTH1 family